MSKKNFFVVWQSEHEKKNENDSCRFIVDEVTENITVFCAVCCINVYALVVPNAVCEWRICFHFTIYDFQTEYNSCSKLVTSALNTLTIPNSHT